MAEKLNKVCTNFAQDFTEQEKAQGRANIDAASAQELDELEERVEEIEGHQYTAGENITIVDDVISATDTTYTAGSHVSIDPLNVISADVGDATITLVKDGVEVASFSANQKTDVSIDVETIAPTKPYISLERLDAYLYRVTFDSLPEPNPVPEPFIPGGCSSYVQDGKLYRNLDWNYDNAASFIVRTHDFVGMSYLTGLDDGHMDDDRIAQLPYRMVDGLNNDGIRVSTHVLFNDWQWTGTGERSVALTNLPYIVLSRVKSMATMSDDLGGVLGNLYAPDGLLATGYLIQLLVTDGTTTCAILPPTVEGQPFTIQDITSNPKLTNFRWVGRATVARTDSDLQRRPTGIARWNMMPCELEDLRFTAAYESDARLDEFIGIRDTDKDSTDAELRAIYETAHAAYLHRERDGVTWQTMHSVVYGDHSMEHLWVQERWFKDEANNLPIHIYTAGENVSISEDDVISAVDTTYSAGEHIVIDNNNEISTTGLQETLTAGDNISIVDNVISAVDTTYSAGEHIVIDNNNEISTTGLQETLTAGENISISSGNVISATDTKYTAGSHIAISSSNQISTTGLQNKLTASGHIVINGDLIYDQGLQEKLVAGPNISISQNNNVISATDTTYTAGANITIDANNVISATSAPQVQSDWEQSDTSAVNYIRNKPDLSLKQDLLTAGENITIVDNVISATGGRDVQADWEESDTSDPAFIQNKPEQLELVAGTNVTLTSGENSIIISASNQGSNICWEQTTQGGTSRYPASLMVINQDTHRLSMDNVNLGTVVPLVSTVSTSNDRVLTVQANDTVPMWSDAPKGVFVGRYGVTTFEEYYEAFMVDLKAVFCQRHNASNNVDCYKMTKLSAQGAIFVRTLGTVSNGTYDNVTNDCFIVSSVDSVYTEYTVELQKKLTAGSNISIAPGANNTTVINNTMHESVIRESLFWSTLSNTEDRDFYYGPWRVHLHCDPILNNWNMENVYPKIFVRINYAGAPDTSLVNQGSYRVQNFNPYKNGFVRDDPQVSWNESNVHYYYDGVDPYTQTQSGSQWGFALHMTGEQPTTYEPENQPAHRFIVDSGRPFGDWLELEVETRFTAPNLAPSSSAILILFKGRYAYHAG